jgi:hypothetical protein
MSPTEITSVKRYGISLHPTTYPLGLGVMVKVSLGNLGFFTIPIVYHGKV